jgi:P-type E1-E2 ATPase
VNLATERADVTLDRPVDHASLVRAIEDAGYEVLGRSVSIVIKGMTCAFCAEMGVLFRKGEDLQSLKDARVVALDKTGTLTEGKPNLTDMETTSGHTREEVLALVASVETKSEHPIARAIVEAAKAKGLKLSDLSRFDSVTGYGVSADVGGRRVEIGADRFMAKLGLDVGAFATISARLADEGKLLLYAAVDGKLAAIIAVADPIKASTPEAIQALHTCTTSD